LAAALAAVAASAVYAAPEFTDLVTVSQTMGINTGRLCQGDATRGDVSCPTYAPSLTTAGDVSVTGNLSAAKFIGDGSGLTGLSAAASDRISSTNNQAMVVTTAGGTVSLTTGGVGGTAYFDATGRLIGPGVSTTGPISGTAGYFSGLVGIGTAPVAGVPLTVSSQLVVGNGTTNLVLLGNSVSTNNSFLAIRTASSVYRQIMTTGGMLLSTLMASTDTPSATLHVSGTGIYTSWTAINQGLAASAPLEVSGTVSASILRLATAGGGAACASAADDGKLSRNPVNGKIRVCRYP